MKCLLCENLSFLHICEKCQYKFLKPTIKKRKIKNIEVISFYEYKEIKDLLHTKHTDIGYYIFSILAKNSFQKFTNEFIHEENKNTIASISIDDNTKSGYSHTAILNKKLKSDFIKPLYTKLRAKNEISYSGKSREFRVLNPRNFIFKDFKQKYVILVDDIITTGSTLSQAIDIIKRNNKEVLFCLVLADASG